MLRRKYWLSAGIFIAIILAGFFTLYNHTTGIAATPTGSVSGIVWQDFCKSDCVAGSSLKRGNAIVNDAERRLSSITVTLAKGKCSERRPANKMAITNKRGFYIFSDLRPGFYCVSINSRQSSTAFPKPGYWTRPAASGTNSIAQYSIKINGPSNLVNKSFGWNYK
ncbi:MAG: hypothetical protein H6Q37_971 [Chloroflexi bacterium]|nr:hypothetical protein [Chloroflexota bacterium]